MYCTLWPNSYKAWNPVWYVLCVFSESVAWRSEAISNCKWGVEIRLELSMVGSVLEAQPVENAVIVCVILNQLLNCFSWVYKQLWKNVIQHTFHYKRTEQKHNPFGLGCLLVDNVDQCLILDVKSTFLFASLLPQRYKARITGTNSRVVISAWKFNLSQSDGQGK